MTLYHYRAFDREGMMSQGIMDASSRVSLSTKLQQLGYSLISASLSRTENNFLSHFFLQRVKLVDLKNFFLHLEQFETAGIALKESLEELCAIQESKVFRKILLEINEDIQRGISLSQALLKHPRVFDAIMASFIVVGEKTGRFSPALQHLTQYLHWKHTVHAKILKALRYPLIMGIFLLVTCVILVAVFVPELLSFILSFNLELPLSTRILVGCASFLSSFLPLLFTLVGGTSCITLFFFHLHPAGPSWKSRIKEALPFVGPLWCKLALLHFFHLFSALWESGIDVLEILNLTQNSSSSFHLKRILGKVKEDVQEGQSLSLAFQRTNVFPSIVIRMINVGEKTSTLAPNLAAIKDYLNTSLQEEIDHFISLLEPLMLLIIGGFMAWIIMAVFLPLYETLVTLEC
jgi:type IV pilus assembly protein PilC